MQSNIILQRHFLQILKPIQLRLHMGSPLQKVNQAQ